MLTTDYLPLDGENIIAFQGFSGAGSPHSSKWWDYSLTSIDSGQSITTTDLEASNSSKLGLFSELAHKQGSVNDFDLVPQTLYNPKT